jgi:hypothetical protein
MCARIPHSLWAVAVATAALVATPLMAAEAGQLAGLVTDEEGNAIAGARLTMTGPATAGTRRTTTDAVGRYRLVAMDAVRPVDILVEADGKVAVRYRELRVRPDRLNRLDVRLRSLGTHDVIVLMDPRVPYHRVALDGARSVLSGSARVLEMTDASPSWRQALATALEESPSAVLAIGEEAAGAARSLVRDLPVVHCMVPDPNPSDLASGNLCGVPLVGAVDRQVERLRQLDPRIRRIGTIYDPSRLSDAVARFRRSAAEAGLTLVTGHVHQPEDFPHALDDLVREDPDAFVVLLDPEVYTARNFSLLRQFIEEKDRILIVPDPSMAVVEKSFTFGPGFWDSGAAAGRLVKQIVDGRLRPADIGLWDPSATDGAFPGAEVAARGTQDPDSEPPLVGMLIVRDEAETTGRNR